jgi:ABC-type antimicrobial peptide transport system permease subunit
MLERRRELAVLLALGMRGWQVVRLVVLEAAILGMVGAAAGLLVAAGPAYYLATRGIDLAALMGGEVAVSGVVFDAILYADMGWWMVPRGLLLGLVAALAASGYPVFYVLRTNLVAVLSLREG